MCVLNRSQRITQSIECGGHTIPIVESLNANRDLDRQVKAAPSVYVVV